MTEKNKVRTPEEVTRDYTNLCTKGGDLQYKIYVQTKELELVNNSMRDLNLEYAQAQEFAAQVQAKLNEEKAKEAAATTPDNVTPITEASAEGAKSNG